MLSRFLLANALAELGQLGEALRIAQEGVDIAEATDHPWTKSLAYCGLGYVRLRKGDLTEAIHRHILMMADTLSKGIIKQFPRRFR